MEQRKKWELTSAGLHLTAMGLMLLDHLWATVVPGNEWMTCLGRLAFPIFAFLIVEGYVHTRNLKRYLLRLGLFAVVSEIPFNLMYAGRLFYPFHQNVLWSFLMALGLIRWNDLGKHAPLWRRGLRYLATLAIGFLAGTVTMVDYYGFGILMVLTFWFFRGRSWWQMLMQLLLLWWINGELMGGLYYEVELFGRTWELQQQALAVLALIPIWLYRGRKGHSSRIFQLFCYGFYPAHMLLLALIQRMN